MVRDIEVNQQQSFLTMETYGLLGVKKGNTWVSCACTVWIFRQKDLRLLNKLLVVLSLDYSRLWYQWSFSRNLVRCLTRFIGRSLCSAFCGCKLLCSFWWNRWKCIKWRNLGLQWNDRLYINGIYGNTKIPHGMWQGHTFNWKWSHHCRRRLGDSSRSCQ